MIGTVLSNRYKIIGELGSGGMAWVYLAEDLRENELVAVKILYPQYSQDLGFLQRFVQESKLAMSLSTCAPTRQIVCVLDYGSDRDIHYLVMEYVQGKDLGQVLDERGPLPWQETLEIGRQVAMALAHADQYEIVHRDIKPENIMILPDGTVRVLDFGIARARTSPHLTLTGFVGSPHYAAPEQAMGKTVDIRADIYSLGVVIYRMLRGDLPFQGSTPWAIVNQHIEAPPPPLAEVRPDLPRSVLHLVDKAMAKRPEDRFQLAEDMIETIARILEGQDLTQEEASPPPVAAPPPAADIPSAEELYQRAQQAAADEAWHEAMDLYSQVLKIDPSYIDVTKQLAAISRQIRLATLYRAAKQALQLGHWGETQNQLTKIAELDPGYKNIDELRAMAERQQMLEPDGQTEYADYATQVDAPIRAQGPAPATSSPTGTAGEGDSAQVGAGSPRPASPAEPPVPVSPPEPLPPRQMAPPEQPQPEAVAHQGRTLGGEDDAPTRRRSVLPWVAALILLVVVPLTGVLVYRMLQTPAAIGPAATASATETLMSSQPVSPTSRPSAVVPEPSRISTPTRPVVSTPATSLPAPTLPANPALSLTLTPSPGLTLTLPLSPTPPPLTGQIAFPRFDPNRGTYDVHVCQVDGSNCRQVAAESSQPDFLPDGTRLVVHSWKADDKGLILQSLSGQRIWKITSQFEAARPSVDWQGSIYVYHSRQEADRQPRLYRTYDAETRPIQREANTVLGQSPSWTPDGRILYSGCWQDNCGIIVMNEDGTNPRQVVAGGAETNPEASPDGRQVAFMSRRDGNWEIYVAEEDSRGMDSGILNRLTDNPANDGLPTWSPDGSYIAFVSDREKGWAVWVMRPDGTDQHRLFALGSPLDGEVRDASPHETHGWVEERISWAPLP